MKDRLPALDGLRGLAALAVVLSHAGYSPALLTTSPLLLTAYQALAVGPNSVQILFVLSGFLMAFLYPSIPSATKYIQKRYARIFPVYSIFVLLLWTTSLLTFINTIYYKFVLLFIFAVLTFLSWKMIKRFFPAFPAAKVLFWTFIILQIIVLSFNILITPKLFSMHNPLLTDSAKSFLTMISNITLTTPFAKDIPRMSGVFWSLAPEVLFYLVYPFIVIPLIYLGKKFGIFFTLFLIVCTTKIFFDLDHAIASIAALHSMNIARASGFIVGVVIGTIYQRKGTTWKRIFPIISNPFFSLFALTLFFIIQWGDGAIRHGQSIFFMNVYYLISSWVIALIILSAIIPKTITHKIFSNKLLVFIGFISYSLYLTHIHVLSWTSEIFWGFGKNIGSTSLSDLLSFIFGLGTSILIAWILFHFIERLYFQSKKPVLETTMASESEKVEKEQPLSRKKIVLTTIFTTLILFVLYASAFSPTLLLSRHSIPYQEKNEISLLNDKALIPFTSSQKDLSAVYLRLRYAKTAGETLERKDNPAQINFKLYDETGKELFSYSRAAYQVEGSPLHGFGFPSITDSQNKTYKAQLSLQHGDEKDQVFVDTSSTSFVSVYTLEKTELLHHPHLLLLNRVAFVFTNPNFLFSLSFITILLLYPLISKIRRHRQ